MTDTFPPDLNGVSLTMDRLRRGLESRGHRVTVVRPSGGTVPLKLRRREAGVWSLPVPGYPGLRFGLPSWLRLWRLWSAIRPDVIYVATEGPLGWAVARFMTLPISERLILGAAARRTAAGLDWDRIVRRFEELLTSASSSPSAQFTPSSPHALAP